MKKILLTMVALLSLTAVQAQESDNKQQFRGPRQMTPEQMTERMSENLKLTDEQKTKVLELNKEYEKVLAGPGMRGPRPQRRDGESGATAQNGQQRPERPQMTEEQRQEMQKRMEQRQEYEKKLKEILTEDQYKKYQESRPQRRGFGRGPGRGGRRGGFGGQGGPRPQF
jgi:Spy/CpxP family protein refolding chaperone